MQIDKEDIPALDFLLSLMLKRDSMVSGEDLKSFGRYQEENGSVVYSEFKRLMFFFDHFGCGDPMNDRGLSEWINPNLSSAQFKHSGGFKQAYENMLKESEEKQLEKDLKNLQKENLEYSKTIRAQESRIRDLNEELKFMSLVKQYWWFIGACIGLGYIVRVYLDRI